MRPTSYPLVHRPNPSLDATEILQTSGLDLTPGKTVETMLSGKSITFEKLDQPGNEDWQRVSLEDDVKVIEKKQVRFLVQYIFFASH